MKNNSLNLSHDRFVSLLYSLTGPQENLPTVLSDTLKITKNEVIMKLQGAVPFTSQEIEFIQDRFNNSALHIAKIA